MYQVSHNIAIYERVDLLVVIILVIHVSELDITSHVVINMT